MTQTTKKAASLKTKLIAMSLGITVLLGASSFGVLQYIFKKQTEGQTQTIGSFAENLDDAIAAQFFERYGDVQAFAFNPAIRSSERSTIVETLNAYAAMYGIYDLIMVVDAKGRLVAVNSKAPDGKELSSQQLYEKNYSEAPWFQAVMNGQFTDDKERGFAGTYAEHVQVDPYTTQVFGTNRLGSSFSAPIKDSSGKTIGVVSNRAGSRWFEVAFKELFVGLKRSGYESTQIKFLGPDGTLFFQYGKDKINEAGEVAYNWDSLLKENLFKAEQEYIKAIKNSETGALVSHESDGSYMVGYATMNAPKFVPKLGWSLIVKDDEAEVMAVFHRAQKIFYFVFGCVLVLAVFGSFWFSNDLSRRLSDLAVKLNQGSVEVASAAGSINTSSIELSEAATEQASAIQQTAASIDEVSAMVKKSADNATQSQKVSQSSREAAEGGQQAVTEMMHSIAEISQSNAAIMNQVEEGNRQISEIVKVIAEIGNKTKVINDIVFQTKLLSFNASVEAARAGEHGKGFAVVAEEVGNLAQMSGNAAKEISAMLEGSIQKVEGIVSETKSKVEKLVVDAKGKVESGTTVAKKCGESLSNILSTVQEVDGMVSEIASASNEQAQGVAEINKAMNQLDQVTQKNTSVAQQAATSSIQLTSQSTELRNMVQDLFYLVSGSTEGSSGAGKMSTKPEVSSYRVGNVVSMLPKKKTSEDSERPLKKAVGAGFEDSPSSLPSKDDPRFEDV